MDYEIAGKTAIVTGGVRGLGAAITEKLMLEGCNVMAAARTVNETVENWLKDLNNKYTAQVAFLKTDVSREEDIDALFNRTLEYFGQVDIVINNAGIWPQAYVKDMETEEFRRTLDVNLIGPFMLCKKMLNYCIDNERKGRIINMVSQAAFHGATSGHAHYAASKAGLVGFTISLAREAAPYGINVNAVAPGIIRSPMIEKQLQDPEKEKAYLARIPLGRVASVDEVADIVLFLTGKQSEYMTGATLDASGGMLMR